MSNLEPSGWAAMIFPCETSVTVLGAVRGSKRLHWTQKAARAEAEKWIEEMKIGPVTWEMVDDQMVLGRNAHHYVVLRSILLPEGRPPDPVPPRALPRVMVRR